MRAFVLPMLMALVLGCGDDAAVRTGDLHIRYRIGSGTVNCAEAMINSLRVRLFTPGGMEVRNDTVACDPDNQSIVLQDLDEGAYDVKIEGLSSAITVIYTGQSSEVVDVIGDQTNGPVTIVLDQVLPSLLLWIDFIEAGNCPSFGVEGIRVVLYKNGSSPEYDETFDCTARLAGSLLIEGLSDTAYYDLRVRGTNANGEFTYEYNENGITPAAGTPTEVVVLLHSCPGLCTSP